ncbi:unnamed protein product [Spirodela intermedia]|uniref:Myb-like domain-containing protein n=1 Tax=Spirodela intermedia TaxID=51605 RepID=A0A7I8L8V2_SPIIN|nr:unnamed protein product [Spirodela intermedia]
MPGKATKKRKFRINSVENGPSGDTHADRKSSKASDAKRKRVKPAGHRETDRKSPKAPDAKRKRVTFSGHVEVFPSTADEKSAGKSNEEDLVRGKRFSEEEDEMIKQAVLDYIKENNLGEDGLQMVLHCRSHREVRHCWREIGTALPWRPRQSVYNRAQNLFRRGEKRKWKPEELDLVRRYQDEHGSKWKEMAELLGKHRTHVKDAWRRIRLASPKKGKWSQEEYQTLFDLVNMDLQLKAFEEKQTKHGMLRENISWGAISQKMSSRYEMACCMKWYSQLTSPMVAQGLWADADDYLMIDGLLQLDACCIEDVDWDNLLEHRSGEICLKRWRQMARHIGGTRERSFMEQVELLATRYCPNMLEYRTQSLKKSADGSD